VNDRGSARDRKQSDFAGAAPPAREVGARDRTEHRAAAVDGAAQVRAVYTKVSGLAGSKPILFGGDINSWKTKAGSHAPFNYMTSKGFHDSTSAGTKVDSKYPTVNHFKTTLKANAAGRQVALDVVMAKGATSFSTYENVMKVTDSSRPSDHNMVVSDLVL